jgi:DNA-binding transcriptional MerR regulator
MLGVNTVEIPNRSLFRQPEVCEIAQVQPYVLRSWEAEFPDLGVSKTVGGPRVYRRADVERVLRLKHLLFVEGLTLAGARRKLQDEKPPVEVDSPALEELLGSDARERILEVKRGLREIATMLGKAPGHEGTAAVARPAAVARSFSSASPTSRASAAKATKRSAAAQPLLDLAAAPARGKKAPAKKKR